MGILDPTDAFAERPDRLGETFLENTKLRAWGMSDLARAPGEYGDPEVEAMLHAYKRYRLRETVPLPSVEDLDLPSTSLAATIAGRRTVRTHGPEPVEFEQLAALLLLSAGVTGRQGRQPLRAAPSAGALYPVETYLYARDVRGLEPGTYHYDWPVNALARLGGRLPDGRVPAVCCGQPQASTAQVVVFLAGVVDRTVRKYGDRGLRYVFLDAGHLAQNLCLAAAALDIACMTTCGFFDDQANDLFGLDGVAESMLYVAFLGTPAVEAPGDGGRPAD